MSDVQLLEIQVHLLLIYKLVVSKYDSSNEALVIEDLVLCKVSEEIYKWLVGFFGLRVALRLGSVRLQVKFQAIQGEDRTMFLSAVRFTPRKQYILLLRLNHCYFQVIALRFFM